jgi:hypothetical protein
MNYASQIILKNKDIIKVNLEVGQTLYLAQKIFSNSFIMNP